MHVDPQESAPAVAGDPDRLIRLAGALSLVGLGRSAWLELVRTGKAPAPIKLGRATAWREAEVREWVRERVRQHRGAGR